MMFSCFFCVVRCSVVKCWLLYEFGFVFFLVNNVWEKKNGLEIIIIIYLCCLKRLIVKKDVVKMWK